LVFNALTEFLVEILKKKYIILVALNIFSLSIKIRNEIIFCSNARRIMFEIKGKLTKLRYDEQ
jgi:hypothetical protein